MQETSPLTLAQRVSDSAQFSVSLLGTPDPPPEIVWTHNGLPINITSAGRLQLSSDRLSLNISSLVESDAGEYKIGLNNTGGSDNVTFRLNIFGKFCEHSFLGDKERGGYFKDCRVVHITLQRENAVVVIVVHDSYIALLFDECAF